MLFAHMQYRNLRNSGLTWQERRSRFLCRTLTHTAVFLAIGLVFMVLFILKLKDLN